MIAYTLGILYGIFCLLKEWWTGVKTTTPTKRSPEYEHVKPGDRVLVELPKAVAKAWMTVGDYSHMRCVHKPHLGRGRTYEITVPGGKPSWYAILNGARDWRWSDLNPKQTTWYGSPDYWNFIVGSLFFELPFYWLIFAA